MYRASFGIDDESEILKVPRAAGVGHLVTAVADGVPESTTVPFVIDDELSSVRLHVARADPHWKSIGGASALMIIAGPDAYVSPSWYPSKAEHHRVVPTSNYELVHVRDSLSVHDDRDWKRQLVSDLTDQFESRSSDGSKGEQWSIDDAPKPFIDKQLTAVVGIELSVASIELKRKMSQNKPDADRLGAAAALRRSSSSVARSVAELMDPRSEH